MNTDYGIPTLVIVAITIGVFIIIAIYKFRNDPPPSLNEKIARQVETIDLFIKQGSYIRSSFVVAERDGATHVKVLDGVKVAFYRTHDGNYEKRVFSTPERPGIGKLGWVSNWQKCRKLPPDVISISEIRRSNPYLQ